MTLLVNSPRDISAFSLTQISDNKNKLFFFLYCVVSLLLMALPGGFFYGIVLVQILSYSNYTFYLNLMVLV